MNDSPIRHVSDTAIWVATYRARESERRDALFRDPFARILIGDEGEKIANEMQESQGTSWSVVIRTCVIDEYISYAISQGVDTVVNLGAGLDARPYRMALPANLNWIEVDYPNLIQLKRERLKDHTPRCKLKTVGVDLAEAAQRREFLAGINSEAKSILVLTEGVLPYLTSEQVTDLGNDLRAQDKITYWIADFSTPQFMAFMQRRKKMMDQLRNAPFRFNPPDWRAFFAQLGWEPEKIGYLVVEGFRRGRRPPSPLIWKILAAFMPAEQKKTMSEMTGYALFKAVRGAKKRGETLKGL